MNYRLPFCVICALIALSASLPADAARERGNHFKPLKASAKKAGKSSKLVKNKKAALKYLDKKGIQPENYDKALIENLEKGDSQTAAALIHAGAAVNASGNEKKPLLLAAEHCTPEVLQLLLDKGADRNCIDTEPLRGSVGMGKTAPFKAAKSNNLRNLKYLHSIGFSCTARARDNWPGHNVLLEAALNGSHECARYIIEKGGGDPHEILPGGCTIMHRAAIGGSVELVKYLESKGVEIDRLATGYGLTPLCFAGQRGHEELVLYMLAKGANPNMDLNRGGMRPLHHLAAKATTNVMNELMKSKADFSLKTNQGKSFRDFARMGNNQEALDFLDKHGL